jgi:transketolase
MNHHKTVLGDSKSIEKGKCELNFAILLKKTKLRLLRMHYESKVGHIGGNLSSLDAMLFLHSEVMEDDDVFVLSKGHSAGALYATLWATGKLSDDDLKTFHGEGTKLAGHPVARWNDGIPFATGSLGHGVSLAAGRSLAKKLRHERGAVFCLTSDGEWQEGSNWEALIFIAHHQLTNITLLIDANGLQGFGTTKDVASMEPLADKMRGFGVNILEIDGHDSDALKSAFTAESLLPRVIILRTVKGKGISFMEGLMEWHYLPMTEAQYLKAVEEVNSK